MGKLSGKSAIVTGGASGMGRGVAKAEYDSFMIDMDEAQTRFREIWEVVQHGMSGRKFSYDGEHIKAPKEVLVRPVLEQGRAELDGWLDTARGELEGDSEPLARTVAERAEKRVYKARTWDENHPLWRLSDAAQP